MIPSIRCAAVRHLRHTTVLAAICVGPLFGGCVSAVDDTTAFGYNKTGATEVAEAAEKTQATAEGVAPADPASAKQPEPAGADEGKTSRLPGAENAAQSASAGSAGAGTDKASDTAVDRDAPMATGNAAIAAFAGSSVLASSPAGQPSNAVGKKANETMFASLYAQSKPKTPIRNVSSGKTRRVVLPREGAPIEAGDMVLPGVRNQTSLFEIGQKASADYDADIIDEASGEEATYQTASVSGLARLAPNGLMVQRPDVQTSCFQPDLVSIIRAVEARFRTKIVVTSGYRNPSHNTRVRGAKRSMHLQCKAADILVPGADKFQVANFVRTLPKRGGVGTYCHTAAIHVDTGAQRDWNWACRRSPRSDSSLVLAARKVAPAASGD